MTHFLANEDNPKGYKLEDILALLRKDLITRAEKVMNDTRAEAQIVLRNNIEILGLLSECIEIAEKSTDLLDRSFGPSDPAHPRIGTK